MHRLAMAVPPCAFLQAPPPPQYAQQPVASAAAMRAPPQLPPLGLAARTAPQQGYASRADGVPMPIQKELPAANVGLPYGGRS